MGFLEAIRTCFRKYLTFSGRAGRSEFWFFVLFVVLGSIFLVIVNGILFGPTHSLQTITSYDGSGTETTSYREVASYDGGWLGTIFTWGIIVPGFAVTWRRLHDRNIRGWWALLPYLAPYLLIGALIATTIGFQAILSGGVEAVISGGLPVGVLAVGLAVVLASWVWFIVNLAKEGTIGPNRFGPSPDGPGFPPGVVVRVRDLPHVGRSQ
ncbi:DUF805 domain-containing protein [uncultured Jannaschia sp.]|uniref:DUF805 domain-containing protein n=1 Tax=uncultured Jannaschia sp. TaxID=293347 RepID=UPI00261CA5CC|nr:DUF805 domain-containing protein [uncultured Jannaschia sp.]